MALKFIMFMIFVSVTYAADIDLLECDPPDTPRWGGYVPRQDSYLPGDVVHYYCDSEAMRSGEEKRYCKDSGKWTDKTPFCDLPASFSSTTQSSTEGEGSSSKAVDGLRNTCSSTKSGLNEEWSGNLTSPGMLYTLKIFLPKGPVSYQILLIRANGQEAVCDNYTGEIEEYDWKWHDCPQHNDATGLKVRSLNTAPLEICEIHASVVTYPTCSDPEMHIENGHLRIDRNLAVLVCNAGFTRSPETSLQCIRDGIWNRKTIYCAARDWEFEEPNSDVPYTDRTGPNHESPDSERLEG